MANRQIPPNEEEEKKNPSVGSAPTQEQENARRKSAPRPTMMDEARRLEEQQAMMGAMDGQMDAMNAQMAQPSGTPMGGAYAQMWNAPIGKEFIQKATLTLQKYKEGKVNLERRIVENEQWYKLRHWECMRREKGQVEPTSGWLFNSIANKLADAMDAFPSPNILPREEGDQAEAKRLSSIVPVVLEMNDFEKTYSEVWNYKLKGGTGVYGVFWDSSKLNGLGDVTINKVDLLSLFWEPGITDIQKSKYLFHVELVDNDTLIESYPQMKDHVGRATINVAEYVYDDKVDTTEKSCVIDMYYKKRNQNGKNVLHFCKFCNDVVLFATENDPQFAERGFYDHGRYPFEFDPMFRVEGTPTGFGYIDVGKSAQEYIDRGNRAILQNMLANARPRYFIRNEGAVNEQEYADINNDFIHVDANLGQDSILPVTPSMLNSVYLSVIDEKINELKETTGNRDVSNGGTTGGVTAASGIAAMQEASARLSRMANKDSYRVFRQIVQDVIELIRQFYDLPRCFRIMGERGAQEFIVYSNAGIQPQNQGVEFGIDLGERIPLFDVEVTAQKASPYSKMAQNELALQFYSAGFFEPMRADQALACLDMMDFDKKQHVIDRIQMNGGMMQQMMMLGQMVDNLTGGQAHITEQLGAQFGIPVPTSGGQEGQSAEKTEALGGEDASESHVTKNARQKVAESTAPQ